MKLHNLSITGITSFAEKVYIDFDEILTGYNLYAITGPTGSGKSSILTSISLALFGRGQKELPVINYISLGKKRAQVEIEFSVNQQKYKSIWSCRIVTSAKTGNSRVESKRVTYNELGEALDVNPEDLIGLGRDQFFKTVIIGQGQFAEFLNAPFSQRKKIIEKLYGPDESGLIAPMVRKLANEKQSEIDLVHAKLDGMQIYSDAEIDEFKSQQTKAQTDLKLTRDVNANLLKFNERHKQWSKEQESLDQKKAQNISLKRKQDELALILKDIGDKHQYLNEKLQRIKRDWDSKKNIIREAIALIPIISENKNHIESIHSQIRAKQSILDKKSEHFTELTKQSNIVSKSLNDLPRQGQIKELELSLERLQGLKQTLVKISKLLQKQQNNINTKAQLQEQLSKIEQNKSDLLLELGPLDKDWSLEQQRINNLLKKNEGLFWELSKLSSRHKDALKIQNEFNEKSSTRYDELLQLKEELSKQTELLDEIKQQIREVKIAHNADLLNFAIDYCKHENNSRSHCIVCHSKINQQELAIGESSIPLNNKEIEKLEESKLKLETKMVSISKDIQWHEEQIQALKTQKEEVFASLITAISNLFSEYDSNCDITAFLSDECKKCQQHIDSLQAQMKNVIQCEQKKKHFLSSIKQLQEHAKEIESKINAIVSENEQYKILLSQCHQENMDIFHTPIENLQQLEQLEQFISLKSELLSLDNQTKRASAEINELQKMITSEQDTQKKIKASIVSLESELKAKYPQYPAKSPQDEQNETEKQISTLESEKESVKNNLDTLTAKKNQLLSLADNLQRELDELEIKNKSNINALSQKSLCLKQQLTDYNKKTQASIIWLNFEINGDSENQYSSHLKNLLLQFHGIIENLLSDNSKYSTLLNEQKSLKEEIQTLKSKKEKLLLEFSRIENLKKLLQNDGFAKFAFGLIEQKLVQYTNKELETLCDGRYQLIEKEVSKRDGPEFFIIDLWQNALARKVATLSGGETFLVSLAMALSLAEMSRGTTEIDTFIIDEGFGTLDDQSIDEVLDILFSIRNRGKQIGLISHIEKLTKRIPVNINVVKEQQGNAYPRIMFN